MNMTSKTPELAARGSLESWLNAAYETLKESGVDAVRVLPLAKKLNLARTSFYWYFEDREALLAALIEQWKRKNTSNLVSHSQAYAASISEAILNVFDCWLNSELFDSQFEFAMRSWALQSEQVAAEIVEADALRMEALKQMFDRFGFSEDAAATRARSIYLAQIGYISMKTYEPLALRMRFIPEYLRIFTGVEPEAHELERFYQRNGFVPPAN
ncbi:TetR/AcrR family transcriptional regulator [Pseudomonas sp. SWRI59]|jgi:Transcriptional regulator|uniref:TetR/AcrR family transcriptional regulator n=1 Tax=Pseudomonas capeferrum TaxID=1495066 RepID=A0ABY7RF74_9PSED|nr:MULTISPECIES: TetR/AcrR family transcriptional regulator [Pseudomonas]KGI92194.1 TetR family transcriptional regulator [Pseudomonas sp. H2]MBC3483104.1 TetR/AcrR family transcriptional regulator [Pseudomonas sp. SWRI77]MBC3502022.1 TetR/AcrR family transcriptional regulator [Pseudomonas sp. SWRI59]MBC3507030.1 TetR/AcrR family transcriptional regulator [Pseudomonas sp. SWRI68]MDD2132503.1 TetR/AcrR family transcriptional regulator [Pseudomonas sp. 17391]